MLPLYEAKMIHHYDHQWATYEPGGSVRDVTPAEKADPSFAPMPRYWVQEAEMHKRLPKDFHATGMFGYRNIARATDARTIIGALIPVVPVGHGMPLVFGQHGRRLQAAFTSFAVDYVLRQKLGGTNLTYNYMQQLPVPAPDTFADYAPSIEARVDRLNAFPGSEEIRAKLRAELDAALFHLYGVTRDDADYILETFPIVKRKDIARHGEYRTKRLILQAYDQLGDN